MNTSLDSFDNKVLRCSKYVFDWMISGHHALFNSILLRKIFINDKLYNLFKSFSEPISIKSNSYISGLGANKENAKEKIEKLYKLGFLVDNEFDEDDYILEIHERSVPSKPEVYHLFLLITDLCNFKCKYCINLHSRMKNKTEVNMSWETFVKSVELFSKYTMEYTDRKKHIFFYGGEPLLNKEVLTKGIEYLRKLEKENRFGAPIDISIISNGTLVDEEFAKFISKHNATIVFSLDGRKEIHDRVRVYANNKGTFDDAVRGYNILKDNGCTVAISSTVCSANIQDLDDTIEYICKELKPIDIGTTYLHGEYENSDLHVDSGLLGEKFIKSYMIAREYGMYYEHFMRMLRPFIEEKFRFKYCTPCGGQFAINPKGEIAPCENFFPESKLHISDKDLLKKDSIMDQWNQRSVTHVTECKGCKAYGMCGGSCPYDAYLQCGDILGIDRRSCKKTLMILDWAMNDLFNKIDRSRFGQDEFTLIEPLPDEQRRLYGKIRFNLDNLTIPNYSEFGEKKTYN